MAILKDGYDIKKTLGRNAARVLVYHAGLDFDKKLQLCQEKLNLIAKSQKESGGKIDERDSLVLKWFVTMAIKSLTDYAKALQEYYKDEPEEYSSNVLHIKIMNARALSQFIGLDKIDKELNFYHQNIITDLVEKAIANYSPGSPTSLNNLSSALHLADQLGFNDLPAVQRAYNNIINQSPEIKAALEESIKAF